MSTSVISGASAKPSGYLSAAEDADELGSDPTRALKILPVGEPGWTRHVLTEREKAAEAEDDQPDETYDSDDSDDMNSLLERNIRRRRRLALTRARKAVAEQINATRAAARGPERLIQEPLSDGAAASIADHVDSSGTAGILIDTHISSMAAGRGEHAQADLDARPASSMEPCWLEHEWGITLPEGYARVCVTIDVDTAKLVYPFIAATSSDAGSLLTDGALAGSTVANTPSSVIDVDGSAVIVDIGPASLQAILDMTEADPEALPPAQKTKADADPILSLPLVLLHGPLGAVEIEEGAESTRELLQTLETRQRQAAAKVRKLGVTEQLAQAAAAPKESLLGDLDAAQSGSEDIPPTEHRVLLMGGSTTAFAARCVGPKDSLALSAGVGAPLPRGFLALPSIPLSAFRAQGKQQRG